MAPDTLLKKNKGQKITDQVRMALRILSLVKIEAQFRNINEHVKEKLYERGTS
jgi:hypothetical protein